MVIHISENHMEDIINTNTSLSSACCSLRATAIQLVIVNTWLTYVQLNVRRCSSLSVGLPVTYILMANTTSVLRKYSSCNLGFQKPVFL